MCGIFAHYTFQVSLTRHQILNLLLSGLQRLEFKGLDSAGFSLVEAGLSRDNDASKANRQPLVVRSVGGISNLVQKTHECLKRSHLDMAVEVRDHTALAHTRWATHGPVVDKNTHPIASDSENTFLVVHNGMIENCKSLRKFLCNAGEKFETSTDTEVLAKLCKYCHQKLKTPQSFLALIQQVLGEIHGAYAIVVTSPKYPGEMVAGTKGSPLMFAIKQSSKCDTALFRRRTLRSSVMPDTDEENAFLECVISSDACALSEHSSDACVLEDGDILHLHGAGWDLQRSGTEPPEGHAARSLIRLEPILGEPTKDDYAHFMKKEIHEQPDSLAMTMLGRTRKYSNTVVADKSSYVLLGGLQAYIPAMLRSRRLIFVGAATSFHACLAVRQLMEQMSGVPVTLDLASDFVDRQGPLFRDDICLFVSQSGETADVLQAVEYAQSKGALCIGITNGVGSALARKTEAGVYLHAGEEIGVASTKTYTSGVLTLILIALKLAENSRPRHAFVQSLIKALADISGVVSKTLQLDKAMQELAGTLKWERSLLFFGRGSVGYATALEAAHKMKEVVQIHSEAILAGEMKHGPLALVDESTPCFVIATKDSMHRKMVSVLEQLVARKGRLIVLCTEGDEEIKRVMQDAVNPVILEIPYVLEPLHSLVTIVPFHLLAYHMTIAKGLNVDQPRNLTKSYSNAGY